MYTEVSLEYLMEVEEEREQIDFEQFLYSGLAVN